VPESTVDQVDGEELRQLLAVEQNLQHQVEAARAQAAARVATARAAGDARLAAARDAAARLDEDHARADREHHAHDLGAIAAAHRAALAAIGGLSDQRVDELARWVLRQALNGNGDSA
jgi:hypothetical protein